jgi:N utilization substance protein B
MLKLNIGVNMKAKRTNSRIKAMAVLYNYDLTQEIMDTNYLNSLFSEEDIETDEDFFLELIKGVIDNWREINKTINLNLRNWTLDRISIVDRTVLRIAVYEMLYTETPKTIIIDEALNLTRIYSETEGTEVKFNNSLLDQIKRSIDGE